MTIHGKTDIGTVRTTNQDTFAFGEPVGSGCFALVCDGMGGENGGNIASQLARDTLIGKITRNMREGMDANSVRNMMLTALSGANSVIFDKGQADPALNGMGTTVVLAVLLDSTLHLCHVGDSRAYLVRSGSLERLTRDHSVVQLLIEQGKITPEQAQMHPQKNQITRALGVESEVQVDYNEFDLQNGDKLLLCTDGLTNSCTEEQILKLVNANSAKQACNKLVSQANKSGGHDNITAIVIEN